MSHDSTPRPAILAALANVYPELFRSYQTFVATSPDEILADLGDQYYIALHGADPLKIAPAEARLSDLLRTHYLGVTVALAQDIAVVVDSSTPAGKLDLVPFRSAI